MMTLPIETATASDVERVIAGLVLAFSTDPAVRWMYPDAHHYLTNFPKFEQAFGGRAFEQNTAFYIDGYSGAALWLRPGVEPDEDALIALLQQSVPEREQENVFAVFEQMGNYHPSEPHWYLPLIGVEPTQQRQGYGSALMKHGLISCDRDNKLAYLESSNPDNIPFYEQHGFELLGTIQVGASPPIFPMLRYPLSKV
jgi:ribosomal protein S18 acetylase RimI-like enzyme